MNSTSRFHPVPLSTINIEDRTYCLTLTEDSPDDKLLASIKRFGILHPPILQKINANSYCVVAGRKRVLAAKHLAPETPVFCKLLSADSETAAIFSLILEEAHTGTPLSIVEQLVFFEKLLLTSPMEEAVPMLKQLGHKPQIHILKNLLKLRSLSEPVLQAMHCGTIHIKNAGKLLNLSETDQGEIVQLITSLRLGGSKQQKLIDLSKELIMRNNLPLKTILADFPAVDALEHPVNIPQHVAALLSWLHNQCFPQQYQAENVFKQQLERLNLPSTMHISHTPAFENEEITLALCFSDWSSFKRLFERINRIFQEK